MTDFGVIADIGGTNARFALVDSDKQISQITKLPVSDYANFEDALADYFQKIDVKNQPRHVLIDVAGPVSGDYFAFTNSHWFFSVAHIQEKFGLNSFEVVNDFAAIGLALPYFSADELKLIKAGDAQKTGPKIGIGPGTGLGVVFMVPHKQEWALVPSEGGHTTMAAENDEEAQILAYLRKKYQGHVSAERVISGHGLENIYEALHVIEHPNSNFTPLTAPQIAENALNADDALCLKAVLQMCAFLGSVSGSLSLATLAYGGVYIAGGIIPQIFTIFEKSDFIKRFEEKGRQKAVNKDIPIYLVTHDYPAFPGLAAKIVEKLKQ